MEPATSFAACLIAALLAVAALGSLLARLRSHRDLRRAQADRLLRPLQRYSAWVCAQRLAAVFDGDRQAAALLEEAHEVHAAWFPELARDMAKLMAVHRRLTHFLGAQHALWLRDPQHWLESEHDQRFMALWRQHRFALHALLARLEQVTRVRIHSSLSPARRQSTYA
jgi:hypothetical protein